MDKKPVKQALRVLENPLKSKPVSQAELHELSMAQSAAWEAHEYAIELRDKIRSRIEAGAPVEAGALFYDPKKRMARESRRKEA